MINSDVIPHSRLCCKLEETFNSLQNHCPTSEMMISYQICYDATQPLHQRPKLQTTPDTNGLQLKCVLSTSVTTSTNSDLYAPSRIAMNFGSVYDAT